MEFYMFSLPGISTIAIPYPAAHAVAHGKSPCLGCYCKTLQPDLQLLHLCSNTRPLEA